MRVHNCNRVRVTYAVFAYGLLRSCCCMFLLIERGTGRLPIFVDLQNLQFSVYKVSVIVVEVHLGVITKISKNVKASKCHYTFNKRKPCYNEALIKTFPVWTMWFCWTEILWCWSKFFPTPMSCNFHCKLSSLIILGQCRVW